MVKARIPESEPLPDDEVAEIQIVNRLRYDEIVTPSKVVAIPGYFSRLILLKRIIHSGLSRRTFFRAVANESTWESLMNTSIFLQKPIPTRSITYGNGDYQSITVTTLTRLSHHLIAHLKTLGLDRPMLFVLPVGGI